MKASPRSPRRLLQAACVLTLAGGPGLAGAQPPASPPASAQPPAVPFDARVIRETSLFTKAKPSDKEWVTLSTGHILSVAKLEPEQTWKGEKTPMAEVRPHAQSSYYAPLSDLRPVAPGEVVSDAQAAALLFQKVPAASRDWCQRFTQRLLLPASAGAGRASMLVYSASNDDACLGYMALVSGTGKAAKAKALPRQGAIQAITVHDVAGGPPLLEVDIAVREQNVTGDRRTLLALQGSTPRELLVVDKRIDRLTADSRHSVASAVKVTPASAGLDIEVHRVETTVALATGAETARSEGVKRYRYAGGKLTAQPAPAGGK